MRFRKHDDSDHSMSIADLMSGLMIVFLFVAITYMQNVTKHKERIRDIVVTYNNTQVSLYEELMKEFKNDLPRWGATIDQETLSISFFEPEILFKSGRAEVTPKFKLILNEFFPRYIDILFSEKFWGNLLWALLSFLNSRSPLSWFLNVCGFHLKLIHISYRTSF